MSPLSLRTAAFIGLAVLVTADVSIQWPPGSQNRGRYDNVNNDDDVDNNNRCTDTQTNAQAGYLISNTSPEFKPGSVITMLVTQQHACGPDEAQTNCMTIVQMITSMDAPGFSLIGPAGKDTNTPDDGDYVNANRANFNGKNGATTANLPELTEVSDTNINRCRREPVRSYVAAYYRQRQMNIYQGTEQQVQNFAAAGDAGDYSQFTRQNIDNTNEQQYGFESNEERDIWPNPYCTPFRDVGVLLSTEQNVTDLCPFFQSQSQNTRRKGQCSMLYPNNAADCELAGGDFTEEACEYNIDPPVCNVAPRSPDNSLGPAVNTGTVAEHAQLNFTVPEELAGQYFSLRVRYNISTGDFPQWGDDAPDGTNGSGENAPVQENQQFTIGSYAGTDVRVEIAYDGTQNARTFTDFTSIIEVAEDDGNACPGGTIYNLAGCQGRRGNIQQTFPAMEYRFHPRHANIDLCDCVDLQIVGTVPNNYGPGNANEALYGNSNAGQGSNNDICNVAQAQAAYTYTPTNMDTWTMIPADVRDPEQVKWNAATSCYPEGQTPDVQLDGTEPYCNVGTFQYCDRMEIEVSSTRNTAFTNRHQRGHISVGRFDKLLEIAIAIAATLMAIALISAGAAVYAKKNPQSSVARLFQNGNRGSKGIMSSH